MASSSSSATSGAHILSTKVARALELRTDTPAMTVALDALAHLPAHHPSSASAAGSSNSRRIDAKSVRSVIEKDALQQALLFQSELQGLIGRMAEMRASVSEIAHLVTVVRESIEADVCCVSQGAAHDSDAAAGNSAIHNTKNTNATLSASDKALRQEQTLANTLLEAFVARDVSRRRYESLNAFLEKFEMTGEENVLLESYNFEDVAQATAEDPEAAAAGPPPQSVADGLRFLDTLDKVRTIRSELSKTVFQQQQQQQNQSQQTPNTQQEQNQQLGATSALRMMETLAQKQERAYERLYNFLQLYLDLNSAASSMGPPGRMQFHPHAQTQRLDDESMDERLVHPFVRRALSSLSHVPSFHSHCLELVAGSRRAEVTRRFLLALTSGYNGNAPIEMRAHDSVSYVGDMLAFVFRSFSVECDLAKGLFRSKEGRRQNSFFSEEEEDEEEDEDVNKEDDEEEDGQDDGVVASISSSPTAMLAHSLSGVSRPLKARIMQVISSLTRNAEEDKDGGALHGDRDGSTGSAAGNHHHQGMGGGGNASFDEVDDFDSVSASAKNRLGSLYSVCGLLLFYQSAMNKTMEKLFIVPSSSIHVKEEGQDACKTPAQGGPTDTVQLAQQHHQHHHQQQQEQEQEQQKASNPLIEATHECLQQASQGFAHAVQLYASMLPSYARMNSDDETEASLAYNLLSMIADARMNSPGFESHVLTDSPQVESSLSLEMLCQVIMNAAMSACQTLEDAVTLKEAVLVCKRAGLKTSVASQWEDMIERRERDLVEELIEEATTNMLHECGLGPVVEALHRRKESVGSGGGGGDGGDALPLPSYPGLSQVELEQAMKLFYSSLFSPPLPQFDMIKEASLKTSYRARTAANVVKAYEQLYKAITEGEGAEYYDSTFLGHTPEQVKTLLAL